MAKVSGKSEILVLITAIFSIMMISTFFFNIPALNSFASIIQRMLIPIVSTGVLVGAISLLLGHVKKISRKQMGWEFSAVLIATYFLYLIVTLTPGLENLYSVMYLTIIGSLGRTTYAIIAPFMVSVAYRAFKIKSTETLFFSLGAVLILFGNAPLGDAIVPGASSALNWLMQVPTMAGMRAITIGVGLGILGYGLRVILGYDRTSLGEFGKESGG